jgi:rubrerythrin
VAPQPHLGGKSPTGDYVQFFSTGQAVKGEFHCADCGYGVTIHRQLPICPMCGGESWEQAPWSPFSRAAHYQ